MLFRRRADFQGELYGLSTASNKGRGGEGPTYKPGVNPCVQVQGLHYRERRDTFFFTQRQGQGCSAQKEYLLLICISVLEVDTFIK